MIWSSQHKGGPVADEILSPVRSVTDVSAPDRRTTLRGGGSVSEEYEDILVLAIKRRAPLPLQSLGTEIAFTLTTPRVRSGQLEHSRHSRSYLPIA